AESGARTEALLALADEIPGWAIVPTTDEDAALVARGHDRLAERFTLTSPGWESLRWAYDKRWTYRLGEDCGIECPWTAQPRDREELASLDVPFPAILKPAVKTGFNRLTAAKAWRVDDRRELLERYDEACGLVAADVLLVQELVPGDGGQYSHAALCRDGEPLATITARRTRQYPADFGRASTFVETIDDPETAEQAAAVFARMQLTGLAEVEFKRDERDGRLKLLDINPRVWGWHTLGAAAGVDFPYLLWQLVSGEDVPRVHARTGVRWLRLSTDLPTAVTEVAHRRMSAAEYLRSLHGPRESAIRSRDDPVPGLLELPLLAGTLARRLAGGAGV
ncbi:MAG: D-aspartate ligase, partial [Gaiellaceae bacterium]|nr:D-aspartate ligase [Gaiellaceae bacterium]